MRVASAFFGALLIVAGIATRIIEARHKPFFGTTGFDSSGNPIFGRSGWPTTTYDAVRVASFALLIFGTVIVALSLVREFRKAP